MQKYNFDEYHFYMNKIEKDHFDEQKVHFFMLKSYTLKNRKKYN